MMMMDNIHGSLKKILLTRIKDCCIVIEAHLKINFFHLDLKKSFEF